MDKITLLSKLSSKGSVIVSQHNTHTEREAFWHSDENDFSQRNANPE